jgi:hypothetical protein
MALTVIGLNHDADAVGGSRRLHDARGRSDAALESVTDHARAAADVPFGDIS